VSPALAVFGAAAIGVGLVGLARLWLARRGTAAETYPSGEIRMIDPRDLLFSLPTIADGVPATEADARPGDDANAAILHEDDWRQVEFSSLANAAFIDSQLEALRDHKERQRAGLGFRDVFVRPEPPTSLDETGLTLQALMRELGASTPMAVFLRSGPSVGRAQGAFAVEVPGLGFAYGSEEAGRVHTLGLALVGPQPQLGEIAGLATLSNRFGLFLVDWLRQERVPSGDAARLRAWVATAVHDDEASPS
jgi:hypothetical protein